MIECEHVSKSFSTSYLKGFQVKALDDVSFSLHRGKTHALVGPNGSGKTTLLSCILGLYHVDQGTIRVFGRPPQDPQARAKLGVLNEHFQTYSDITAVQAIEYYGLCSGRTFGQGLIMKWLSKMDLESHARRNVGGFSKGMMQRLGIIASLIHDPELIVWDEPTSGLDPEGRVLVMNILNEEKQKDKTLVLSTHILSDIDRSCDHMLVLRNGQLKLDCDIREALQEKNLENAESLYMQTSTKAAL